MVAEVGIEPDLMAAYETAVCASSSSPQQNWSTEQESNLRPSVYQTDAQPAVLSVGGSPRQNRTGFSALQERRIAGNACGAEKLGASGANRTPIGRLPCDCSITELHRLEPKGGFEPPSERYEGSVFPTKLLRHFASNSLERVTGFEPVSGPWQGPILAARRYPRGASGENRTLLACLEGRNSANKSRSLELQVLIFSCQRTHFDGSAWRLDPYSPGAHLPDLSAVKTHWPGIPDSNRESHDPKSCGLSRFPSARKKHP